MKVKEIKIGIEIGFRHQIKASPVVLFSISIWLGFGRETMNLIVMYRTLNRENESS